MLDKIQSYFGFTTMPFSRALAPGQLFHSGDHAQAAARIGYSIATRGITVITGASASARPSPPAPRSPAPNPPATT